MGCMLGVPAGKLLSRYTEARLIANVPDPAFRTR